jgi:hypothetical protein
MNIFRIFKEFLDTRTYKTSQILTKHNKQLTRKYHIFFNQDLTHNNITKMSKKRLRTHRNFLGVFYKNFKQDRGAISKQLSRICRKRGCA